LKGQGFLCFFGPWFLTGTGFFFGLFIFQSRLTNKTMMLKKLTIYIVLAVLCLVFEAMGQDKKVMDVGAKGLQVGDKLPDVLLSGLHNYKDKGGKVVSSARLSDFKGKLLILDFWATWCAPCVAMIPRMDSLQRVFGDKVQFLSVTYQSAGEVLPFLQKLEKQQGGKLGVVPVLPGDETLRMLFPHVYLPHYVWIDSQGVVKAITGAETVSASGIKSVLNGGEIAAQKKDLRLAYDEGQALLVNGNGGDGSGLRYHSVFTGYIEGLGSKNKVLPAVSGVETGFSRITVKNLSMEMLYGIAYGKGQDFYLKNRIILENGTSLKDPNWKATNRWCYELILPEELQSRGYELMREDLDRFFSGYRVALAKREVECYGLEVVEAGKLPGTRGGKSAIDHGPSGITMENAELGSLVKCLQLFYYVAGKPIVDLTGLAGRTDLVIDADPTDVGAMNEQLARYGLKISLAKRWIDMIVIAKVKGSNKEARE